MDCMCEWMDIKGLLIELAGRMKQACYKHTKNIIKTTAKKITRHEDSIKQVLTTLIVKIVAYVCIKGVRLTKPWVKITVIIMGMGWANTSSVYLLTAIPVAMHIQSLFRKSYIYKQRWITNRQKSTWKLVYIQEGFDKDIWFGVTQSQLKQWQAEQFMQKLQSCCETPEVKKMLKVLQVGGGKRNLQAIQNADTPTQTTKKAKQTKAPKEAVKKIKYTASSVGGGQIRVSIEHLTGLQAHDYLNTNGQPSWEKTCVTSANPAAVLKELEAIKNKESKNTFSKQHLIMACTSNHWVMIKVNKNKTIEILDPYSKTLTEVSELTKGLKEVWNTTLITTMQQPLDDTDSCGYRTLIWAQDFRDCQLAGSTKDWVPPMLTKQGLQKTIQKLETQVTTVENEEEEEKKVAKQPTPPKNNNPTPKHKTTEPATQPQKTGRSQEQQQKNKPNTGLTWPTTKKDPQQQAKPTRAPRTKSSVQKAQSLKTTLYQKGLRAFRRWRGIKRDKETKEFTIISHNMRGGWESNIKKADIEQWLGEAQPEVLMLQEPNLTIQGEPWHKHISASYKVYTHIGEAGDTGVVTLIHNSVRFRVLEKQIIKDKQGRFMAIPIKTLTPQKLMWVINIYGPVSDVATGGRTQLKKQFWENTLNPLMQKIHTTGSEQDIIVVGTDANAVMDVEMDTNWEESEKNKEWRKKEQNAAQWFQKAMATQHLQDIWREYHLNERQYTRRSVEQKQIHKRIDYIMVNEKGKEITTGAKITPIEDLPWGSDHDVTEVRLLGMVESRYIAQVEMRKPVYDPTSIMQHKQKILNTLGKWAETGKLWTGQEALSQIDPMIESCIKEAGITQKKEWYTPKPKKPTNQKLQDIEQEIQLAQAELKIERKKGQQQKIEELEAKIRRQKKLKIREILKARATIQEIAKAKKQDQSTVPEWEKYKWNINKKPRNMGMALKFLKTADGTIKYGEDVEPIIKQYMGTMWGTKEQIANTDLPLAVEENLEKLKRIDQILNRKLQMNELKAALTKLKKNKTPGVDLLPNEIFLLMSGPALEELLRALEDCRQKNRFPQTWKETELRWIYKNKDPLLIENYRPIALAVVAYKIFTRIYTARLEEAVETEQLVTDEQQGFRSDRSCHSAALMMEVIKGRRKAAKTPLHIAYLDISL